MKSVSKKSSQKFSKFSAEYGVILIVLFLAILISALPHILRDTSILAGDESYNNLRLANLIQERGITHYDPLSYGGRSITTPLGWPFVLAEVGSLAHISLNLLSKILPFIFGIIAALTLYILLRTLKLPKKVRMISTLAFIISPVFIYLFATSNPHFIPLVLNLLAFYFLIKNKKILTTLLIILTTFFGIMHPLIGLAASLVYVLRKNKKVLPWFYLTSALTLIPLLIKYVPIVWNLGLPLSFTLDKLPIYQELFSDLGGKLGVSLFALILAFIGIVVTWKKKHNYITIHAMFILLFVISIFYLPALIYLNILLAVLLSLGMLKLMQRKWESKFIKNFTILILALGLIFSGLSYANQTADSLPNKEVVDSLSSIKDRGDKAVFSHYSNGYWISAISGKPNVMDSSFDYAPNLTDAYKDSQKLFYSRDLKNSTEILQNYNVGYILITTEMKEGEVWNKDEEGLLFLLKFSENFENKYYQKGVELWEVKNLTLS